MWLTVGMCVCQIPTATERRMRGRPKPDQAAMDALAAAAVPDPSIKVFHPTGWHGHDSTESFRKSTITVQVL